MWLLYAIIGLCFVSFVDFEVFNRNMCVQTLNLRMPSFAYLRDNEKTPAQYDRRTLKKHIEYFEWLTIYFPNKVDSYGMLGFSYYQVGDIPKALAAYKKAHEIASKIFIFPHSAGVIYFKEGKYHDSALYLQKAVECSPTIVAQFLSMAGEYQRLFMGVDNAKDLVMGRLDENYRNCYLLLVESYLRLHNYEFVARMALSAIKMGFDGDGTFSYYAGLAALKRAMYSQANFLLMQSIKKNPENADAFALMAMSLKATGDHEKAVLALEKSMALQKQQKPDVPLEQRVFLPLY